MNIVGFKNGTYAIRRRFLYFFNYQYLSKTNSYWYNIDNISLCQLSTKEKAQALLSLHNDRGKTIS